MPKKRMTEITSSQREPEREQRIFTINKATQLIWLLFGTLEVLIALRIGLTLIGANPESPIFALIYRFTYLVLFPFTGLIGSPTSGSIVLELSSMFSVLFFGLIAWVVERTVWLIFFRTHGPPMGTTQTTTIESHTTP
jgi:hypothetical protein